MLSNVLQKPSSNKKSRELQGNEYIVPYGTRQISFDITYSDRKTLEIAVYPDQKVWVTAPEDTPLAEIKEKVVKRAKWIVDQKRYFERFDRPSSDFEYVSGENSSVFRSPISSKGRSN